MRVFIRCITLILIAFFFTSCAEGGGSLPNAPPCDRIVVGSDEVSVHIGLEPFHMKVMSADGDVVLKTRPDGISVTHRDFSPGLKIIDGFDYMERIDGPDIRLKDACLLTHEPDTASLKMTDPGTPGLSVFVTVYVDGREVNVDIEIKDSRDDHTDAPVNVIRHTFTAQDTERFVGLGERESGITHDGRTLACWAEEGGIGGGEATEPGPQNPYPNGEGMTHFPVPFYMSSAGYGLWVDTSYRSEFSFGPDGNGTVSVSVEGSRLRYTIFVNKDPKNTLADFTYRTGRARLPAPWVFGPRKRVGSTSEAQGMPEIEALRVYDIPMTMVDDAIHFQPHASHKRREEELEEWTARAHELGYKVMGYFNPYVSADHEDAEEYRKEGREKDVFVRLKDGTEFQTLMISGHPQNVLTLDLTNPDAVAWYEARMQEALDLGYDGWMLDFGEYLPRDALLMNGMTGDEAHNLYPLMAQEATRNFLDRERGNDYLFYVRSGYTGTTALVPMVWSGDPSASFGEARGLPAHVRAGISAGLSGIPYWGSDGTGFTCLSDPPADKKVYLRWMAFAALSPDMHEQNACAANTSDAKKWKLWNDEETIRTYAKFTRLHTRLFPYIYRAAEEATETGMPIMRHALLYHHDLPEAWEPKHEYYFGPHLYVAPVVRRGETSRELWLPPGTWFDWWTLKPTEGNAVISRDVPLDVIPIYLKEGGIVPMLAPDVDTLADTDHPWVVDMYDRQGVLYVRAAVTADAPKASISLVDGCSLSMELTGDTLSLADGMRHISEDEVGLCASCGRIDDMSDGTRRIRVSTLGSMGMPGMELVASGADDRLLVHWDIIVLP